MLSKKYLGGFIFSDVDPWSWMLPMNLDDLSSIKSCVVTIVVIRFFDAQDIHCYGPCLDLLLLDWEWASETILGVFFFPDGDSSIAHILCNMCVSNMHMCMYTYIYIWKYTHQCSQHLTTQHLTTCCSNNNKKNQHNLKSNSTSNNSNSNGTADNNGTNDMCNSTNHGKK